MGFYAFGGPQFHIPYFINKLVREKKLISQEELLDINAFCSILPGPSTTQTITAIGYKLGGPRLAMLTLLAWVLPGATILSLFTLIPFFHQPHFFTFFPAMVAAFLLFAFFTMCKLVFKFTLNYFLIVFAGLSGFFIKSPIVFPSVILIAAVLSAIWNKRQINQQSEKFGTIKYKVLILLFIIFITVAAIGNLLSRNEKTLRLGRSIVLFENTYRMGSLAFGGGNALAPMIVEQYVRHTKRLTLQELNIGLGLIQAMPGPNYNIGVFINGLSMKKYGYGVGGQIAGCIVGMIAIFLPGILLIFFAFPLWSRIKKYAIVQKSLDGVFAASVGFVGSAALLLNVDFWNNGVFNSLPLEKTAITSIFVFSCSLLLLLIRKIPVPLIVVGTILAGIVVNL